MEQAYIAVVGGVNIDINGTPDSQMIPGDSNPGRVSLSMGGVGRNIAENLLRLGRKVRMITALGEDEHARLVESSAAEIGLDLSESIRIPGGRTSTYLCLNDSSGDLVGAVADMEIYDHLTPEQFLPRLSMLNGAAAVVLDANLPETVLTWLARNLTVPVLADPVSVKKSGKLQNALPYLTVLKPNRAEASCLTGLSTDSREQICAVARNLSGKGVKNIFLSLGSRGVYYENGKEQGFLPCFDRPVLNTSGCGDAFLSSVCDAMADGLGIRECALRGLAASAICAGSSSAVSPLMTKESVIRLSGV